MVEYGAIVNSKLTLLQVPNMKKSNNEPYRIEPAQRVSRLPPPTADGASRDAAPQGEGCTIDARGRLSDLRAFVADSVALAPDNPVPFDERRVGPTS